MRYPAASGLPRMNDASGARLRRGDLAVIAEPVPTLEAQLAGLDWRQDHFRYSLVRMEHDRHRRFSRWHGGPIFRTRWARTFNLHDRQDAAQRLFVSARAPVVRYSVAQLILLLDGHARPAL